MRLRRLELRFPRHRARWRVLSLAQRALAATPRRLRS